MHLLETTWTGLPQIFDGKLDIEIVTPNRPAIAVSAITE